MHTESVVKLVLNSEMAMADHDHGGDGEQEHEQELDDRSEAERGDPEMETQDPYNDETDDEAG